MENRIHFRLGGKSYDLTETKSSNGTWFDWVESSKLHMRRMTISKEALLWLVKRLREASDIRGEVFKSWRGRDLVTYLYFSLKFNKYGRFISMIAVNGASRSVIILPENNFNEGWLGLATKIEGFINGSNTQLALNAKETIASRYTEGEKNYKEAMLTNRWAQEEQEIQQEVNLFDACKSKGGNELLSRCLVGCFPECDEIPTRTDVRRWAQQAWKGVHNLQVFDLNGIQFLFEFQSRKIAEHILGGEWKRQGKSLKLEWWSPTTGAYSFHAKFHWFWIRALGLPLQLWSEKVMKKIGDQCGGWLETEEETLLKNHMRWARIKVKGPLEEIPRFIEIVDGDIVFSLPIWVEAPARYKMVNEYKLDHRDERDKSRKKVDSLFGSLKEKETEYERGERRAGKYPMDIEELELEGTWDMSRGVTRGNGSTGVGPMET